MRAAIEATLAELAHDIRTPLTGILALGELLATSDAWRARARLGGRRSKAPPSTSPCVDLADRRCRARRVPRVSSLRRDLIRPRALADALAASLTARAETKGLTTEVIIAADLPEAVIGDPLRLRAALENLIDNAVKFTDRGGVAARRDERSGWRAGACGLRSRVTDSGIGLERRRDQAIVPAVRRRPMRASPAATAAPVSGLRSSSASPRRCGGDLTVKQAAAAAARSGFTATVDAGRGGASPNTATASAATLARSISTPAQHSLRRGQSLRPRRCSTPSSPSWAIAPISSRPARRRSRRWRRAATMRC